MSIDEKVGEKVVMKTQQVEEEGASVVNLTVSHVGLVANLLPLGATRTVIQNGGPEPQVQSGGPKKKNEKTLKDITNKLKVRPIIAKNSKPNMKVNDAQIKKEFRILKRSGEVWRGEGTSGPPPQKARLRNRALVGFPKWVGWG